MDDFGFVKIFDEYGVSIQFEDVMYEWSKLKGELSLIGTYFIGKFEGVEDKPEKMINLVDRNYMTE